MPPLFLFASGINSLFSTIQRKAVSALCLADPDFHLLGQRDAGKKNYFKPEISRNISQPRLTIRVFWCPLEALLDLIIVWVPDTIIPLTQDAEQV